MLASSRFQKKRKNPVRNLIISHGSHVSLVPQSKIKLEKRTSPPSSSGAANQQLAEVGECQFVFVDLVAKLIQCLGVWCRVTAGGFLAAGFGIILGCGALGSGGLAGARARLAVRPAGGLGGMSATAVPAGRVSLATTFFHWGLQSRDRLESTDFRTISVIYQKKLGFKKRYVNLRVIF